MLSLLVYYRTKSHHYTEVWGKKYKSNVQSIWNMQKGAKRIVYKVGYHDHTNILFLKTQTLKLRFTV